MATERTRRPSNEFDPFSDWYIQRRTRQAGRPPSPKTLQSRVGHLALCSRIAESDGHTALWQVGADREALNTLLDVLFARMSPGAVRSYCYSLLAYFEWAKARGLLTHCCMSRADIPPGNPLPAISIYSREEVEALVAAARGQGLRWWALVTFVADTGRRIGEVLSLRWEWVRLNETPAYVELPITKTGRPQYVPLTRRLRDDVFVRENIEALMQERREGRRAFKRSPNEFLFPWQYNSVMKRLEYFCGVVGLPYRGWHAFRHSLITHRLADGVPLHAVAKLAGHSSVAVTQARYDHTSGLTFARYIEHDWRASRVD